MSTVIKDLGAVSAYAYAVEKGYAGTEAEFAELMADYAEVGQMAEDAAESALNSKTAAQAAATTATNKASEATTAAQTATTKAGEASQSASDANTAKDEAVTAKTAAETAQGKAEDAQAAAESVAESIPSDYSQLSEDVSDLKEGLSELEDATATPIIEPVSYTPTSGKLINDHGVITYVASADYCISSRVSVTPGETVTLTGSANYYNCVWAWYASDDTFVSGQGTGGSGSAIVQRTEEVTVPNNASYVRVAYIAPRSGEIVKQTGTKNNLLDRVNAIESVIPDPEGAVTLVKSGNDIRITDVKTGASLVADMVGSGNLAFNMVKYFDSAGTMIKNADDDICPIFYDGSHRCGNHGNLVVINATATAHGLTESDIGKVYTSADNVPYVLVKVPDVNTLWFINDSNTYSFVKTIPTSPMTGDKTVTFSGATLVQLLPGANNVRQSISVDNAVIVDDGIYTGQRVVVFDCYNAVDTLAMLTALKANVGSNTNGSYYADSLPADLIYATTYTITEGLKMVVASKIVTVRDNINLTSWGVVQSLAIGHRLYVPYSTDAGVWTTTGLKTYPPSEWADADFPPNKMYQFDTVDDTKGFMVTYNVDYGNGLPSVRKPLSPSSALTQSSAYKLYPYIISTNVANRLTAGTELSGVALRQLIPLTDTLVATYDFGGAGYAEIDHLAEGSAIANVPAKYNGKRIEVLHKLAGIAVLTTVISGGQIAVVGKGSLSLKLI